MSSALPSEQKNLETNSEPRSEVTCLGTPCFDNTCIMNMMARSLEVQLMVVGMKIPCLVRRLTIMRMELKSD